MLAKNDLVIDGGLKSLEICKRAGIKVGYGSDLLGALQVDQSREFMLRREVLSPIEILRQATLVGAEFVRIFDQNSFVSGFVTSLQVGIAAVIGGLLLGVPASLVLARREFPGREALNTLLVLPLVVPGVVAGTAIYVFQIEIELATELPLLGSRAGLILAHIMITIPWTVRLLTASLSGFDRSIEEAAQNLGATPLQAFLKVTLPVIKPGVVAAALFGFIISFGNLEMTLFLVAPGQTTLPIAILQYLQWRIDPTIAAVSLLQIVLIGAGMLVTDRYVKLTRVL